MGTFSWGSGCCWLAALTGIGLTMVLIRQRAIRTTRRQVDAEVAHMKYFFEGSLDLLCVAGFDGYFKVVNPAWTRILGHTREELTRVPYVSFVHPDDVQATVDEAGKLAQGADEIWFENRYRCKDGSYRWLAWQATPAVERQLLYADARDITDHKAAEDALKNLAAELKRSNEDLSQFAYVASHDLQEPLRMISSYLQLLQRRYTGKLDAEADKFIGFAVDGSRRMQNLIQDLLAFSRIGTRASALVETDLNRVLAEVCENLALVITETGAVVTHDALPTVMADRTQLLQLLQNLIANALKFRAAQPPQIQVSARRDGTDWVVSVGDNGIGIDPQFHDRIFVIFQRLHNRDEYEGTGIGLAMCKKIVERHGGRIWVASTPGQGATFHFTLPGRHPPPFKP